MVNIKRLAAVAAVLGVAIVAVVIVSRRLNLREKRTLMATEPYIISVAWNWSKNIADNYNTGNQTNLYDALTDACAELDLDENEMETRWQDFILGPSITASDVYELLTGRWKDAPVEDITMQAQPEVRIAMRSIPDAKFSIGNRVRIVKTDRENIAAANVFPEYIGHIGTIKQANYDVSWMYDVEFSLDFKPEMWYPEDMLKLISSDITMEANRSKRPLTQESVLQYFEDDEICPFCGSTDVWGPPFGIPKERMKVGCDECNEHWLDLLKKVADNRWIMLGIEYKGKKWPNPKYQDVTMAADTMICENVKTCTCEATCLHKTRHAFIPSGATACLRKCNLGTEGGVEKSVCILFHDDDVTMEANTNAPMSQSAVNKYILAVNAGKGGICPYCKSVDLFTHTWEPELASREAECNVCDEEWYEEFELAGIKGIAVTIPKNNRDAYIRSPEHCPLCGSEGITTGDLEYGNSEPAIPGPTCKVNCNDCSEEWWEVWKMAAIREKAKYAAFYTYQDEDVTMHSDVLCRNAEICQVKCSHRERHEHGVECTIKCAVPSGVKGSVCISSHEDITMQASSGFNVGDSVRIVKGDERAAPDRYIGRTGRLVKIEDNWYRVRLSFTGTKSKSGIDRWFPPDMLEHTTTADKKKVEDVTMATITSEFKIGDRVKVRSSSYRSVGVERRLEPIGESVGVIVGKEEMATPFSGWMYSVIKESLGLARPLPGLIDNVINHEFDPNFSFTWWPEKCLSLCDSDVTMA